MVSHDPISPIQSQRGPVPAASLDLGFDASKTAPVLDCEVVTYPTMENASFALGADFDFSDVSNPVPNP